MRPLPPILFFACGVFMYALDRWLPIAELFAWPWRAVWGVVWGVVGGAVMVLGFGLGISGILMFRHAGTPIPPGEGRSTTLVTGGPYRFTRNPMYLGMVIVLIGLAAILGSASAWLVVPVFVLLIDRLWIIREERWMTQTFGDDYRRLCQRVRRWV